MPAPKRPAKKKQSFLSKLIPTTRKAKIITFVAAFAVIGGGIMVYRSFAATTANYTGGVLQWKWDGSRKYSNRVSTNGTICVDSVAKSASWGEDKDYYVRLFTLVNGKWLQSREVSHEISFDINRSNFDRTCWRGLTNAYLYRVQFDPYTTSSFLATDRFSGLLTYKVYGYDVAKGETSTTSKNPNNTPAPTPAPQPSK